MKSWIKFGLMSLGLVVVLLWVFRKLNPSQKMVGIPSGGDGSQASNRDGTVVISIDDPGMEYAPTMGGDKTWGKYEGV